MSLVGKKDKCISNSYTRKDNIIVIAFSIENKKDGFKELKKAF